MLRNVFCEQIAVGGMSTVIDESMCTGEKPEAQKACSEDDDDTDSMSAPKVSRCGKSADSDWTAEWRDVNRLSTIIRLSILHVDIYIYTDCLTK